MDYQVRQFCTIDSYTTALSPCTVQCRSGQLQVFPIESEAEITSNLNSLSGHGPSEANLTNAGWCSETLLSTVGPYLQFDFSDVYAVYSGIISGVNDTNVSSYITTRRGRLSRHSTTFLSTFRLCRLRTHSWSIPRKKDLYCLVFLGLLQNPYVYDLWPGRSTLPVWEYRYWDAWQI